MSASNLHNDGDIGEQGKLLLIAAERSADKFGFFESREREAFIHGFVDGATLMTSILRPQTAATNGDLIGAIDEVLPDGRVQRWFFRDFKAAQQNAARYLFLREHYQLNREKWRLEWYLLRHGEGSLGEQLDRTIDAEILQRERVNNPRL